MEGNTYIFLKTFEIKELDTFMYKCNLNCRCKYINVRKNKSKNTQETSVKTSIKLQKTLIEKHEYYFTFMYKCLLKYRCIKYEKNLKNKQTKLR